MLKEYEEGQCQDCGQELNNAEGLYCPEHLAQRAEFRQDEMRDREPSPEEVKEYQEDNKDDKYANLDPADDIFSQEPTGDNEKPIEILREFALK